MAEREVRHDARDGRSLGAVLLHELHAGGGVIEQVAHADGRPLGAARLLHGAGLAALEMERRADVRAARAREDIDPRHGGDGGECLATEAQRPDRLEVIRRAELARCVAQEGRRQLLRRNAAAVVGDAQVGQAAVLHLEHDGRSTGVDGVFEQLLGDARRALDHLARGDQIRHMGRKALNIRHGNTPPSGR